MLYTATTAPPGYRLASVLGRGRHAVVYLARSALSGRKVAIKLAPRMAAGSGFEREFRLLKQAKHPHVVQVLSHGVTPEQAYLAMEHMEGGDLSQQKGPLPAPRALELLRQVAAALARLHSLGWVHRDLKPANLLLRSSGDIALADFGSACLQGQRDELLPRTVIGTPRYAAPEQHDQGAADPTADVYGLGVLLHEWLVGEPPYPGTTLTEITAQHQLAPVPRLPQALREWQPLLDRMLAKKPGQRWADGRAVLEQLS